MTVAGPALRTWATRFGDVGLAVEVPADFGEIRSPWQGAGDAPIALTLAAASTSAEFADAPTHFSRLDSAGFAFSAASCAGEALWSADRGTLTLHDAAHRPLHRVQMLQESLFAMAYARILRAGGLLLHAATLWLDGQPFVVAGPSTAGKSTLSRRFHPDWWSDEHAFLVPTLKGWEVWRHLEFRGNSGPFPWRAPLGGLLWLGPERAQSRTHDLTPAQALAHMLPQALVAGPQTSPLVLAAVAKLCADVQVRVLSHHLGTSPADLAQVIVGAVARQTGARHAA